MQHSRTTHRLLLLSRTGLLPVEHQEHQRSRGHAMGILRRNPGRPQPDQLWQSGAAPGCVPAKPAHKRKPLRIRAPTNLTQRGSKLGPTLTGRQQQPKLISKTTRRRTVSRAQAPGTMMFLRHHPVPTMGQAVAVLGTVATGLSNDRPNVLHVWSIDLHNWERGSELRRAR